MKDSWKIRPHPPAAHELARATGISLLEAGFLAKRGVTDREAMASFLSPRLADLKNPMALEDMDKAVALISETLEQRQAITIYGDFDADGFTATALLCNFFSSLGAPTSYYIPDRFSEGYGLHAEALKGIAGRGPGLLITVDCGTTSQDQITLGRSWGLEVVVTDHHQVPQGFTPSCPVINPHRQDSAFPFKHLAGVGVAFFLAVALRAALRRKGWFRHRPEPDLRDYLDLVALGTVADMVPLLDQNRILVKAGLERIQRSQRPGIQAIAKLAAICGPSFSAADLAYRMAPRLNASGRMGETEVGVMALTTQDPVFARELAGRLETMNAERRLIEKNILEEIDTSLRSRGDLGSLKTLVAAGRGWHRGVLGVVASRLADRYHRPVLVLSVDNGMASGSGRSIPGFNLYRALSALAPLFDRYGGHEQAAGLTLKASRIESLASGLEEIAQKEIREDDLVQSIEVDGETTLPEIDLEIARRLLSYSPFGPGNPEPHLYAGPCEVMESRIVGERHLKMTVRQNGTVLDAIGFGLAPSQTARNAQVHLLFTPELDQWQGRERLQLRVLDMEPADGPSKLQMPSHGPNCAEQNGKPPAQAS